MQSNLRDSDAFLPYEVVIADGLADHFQFTQTSTLWQAGKFSPLCFSTQDNFLYMSSIQEGESWKKQYLHRQTAQALRRSRAVMLFESMFFWLLSKHLVLFLHFISQSSTIGRGWRSLIYLRCLWLHANHLLILQDFSISAEASLLLHKGPLK